MDATVFTIPKDYGYVILSLGLTCITNQFHATLTSSYRKAAKIPYPNAYATALEAKESKEKYLFNCAQRAHVNFCEHWPTVLTLMAASGLRYPITSAVMGTVWCASRVVYAFGYVEKDKTNGSGRLKGSVAYIPEIGLLVLTALTGYNMIMS